MILQQSNLFGESYYDTVKNYEKNEADTYETQVNFLQKELKKALFKCELTYKCTLKDLKMWLLNKFSFDEILEDITGEDLYYVAEEICNMEVRV